MKVELKPRAIKDLRSLPKEEAARIAAKVGELEQGLTGDIKRLTNFTPEYRLRIGNYRVLFEVEEGTVVVYRVMHRRHVYAKRWSMNLHPQFIGKEGLEEYVVLPIEEFRAVAAALEDYQDLQDLRKAKEAEGAAASTSLADVITQLGLGNG
jgi:mRNA interferase RelE/StbE